MKRPHLRMLVLALLVAGFLGCRSMTPAVDYYILRPVSPEVSPSVTVDAPISRTVAVHPVELPDSVNRLQMVRRSGSNRLEISPFHRWADYPDRLIQQVVEENLQMLAPHVRVVHHPWPAGLKPDATVHFQFRQLVGTTDGEMLLTAVWSVIATDNSAKGQVRRTTLSEPVPGSGFDDLAAAHSSVLTALCREVAAILNDGQ